ncbi:hypothetical protein [Corynebacterium nasicanis]|uniref:Lipoprotein n=1 Tax=Corynebacterium nasicanis TaxID=1448267 RepID=A0ABW1QDR8_9CORY
MRPARMPTIVAALLSVATLFACAPAEQSAEQSAAPTTVTSTAPAPRAPQPTPPGSTSTSEDCTPGDLADSGFGGHLRTHRILTSTAEYFHFQVRDNAYDSCRDLSWVTLDGTIGDINGEHARPAGTVVFFSGADPVTDYQPRLYAGVDNVRRLDENAALITWRHNRDPRTSEESYSLADGRLEAIGYSTPSELRRTVPILDLLHPPLDSQAGLPPAGNAHGSPYAAELPTGRYLVPLNNEHTLQCELGRDDGVIADCHATFEAHWDERGSNHVTYTISPAQITTGIASAPHARDLPSLTRDSMYRVGTAVVDLRVPNVAKIGLEPGQGVHISPGHVGEIRD